HPRSRRWPPTRTAPPAWAGAARDRGSAPATPTGRPPRAAAPTRSCRCRGSPSWRHGVSLGGWCQTADRVLAERGAPAARREEGEYWTYLTDEQRSGRGPQPARRREPFDTSLLEVRPGQ